RIKHRERYRPFGASVLAESADEWFCLPARTTGARASRDLMLLAYPIARSRRGDVPAVIHADGTCRIQLVERGRSPLYHALIGHFAELTGVPLVLNTSFNDSEPIVCSPADAVATFLKAGVDDLVLGDRVVRRTS